MQIQYSYLIRASKGVIHPAVNWIIAENGESWLVRRTTANQGGQRQREFIHRSGPIETHNLKENLKILVNKN